MVSGQGDAERANVEWMIHSLMCYGERLGQQVQKEWRGANECLSLINSLKAVFFGGKAMPIMKSEMHNEKQTHIHTYNKQMSNEGR